MVCARGRTEANLDRQAQYEHRSDRYQQAIAENTVTGGTWDRQLEHSSNPTSCGFELML